MYLKAPGYVETALTKNFKKREHNFDIETSKIKKM